MIHQNLNNCIKQSKLLCPMTTSAVFVFFCHFFRIVTAYCPHTWNLLLWCIYWIGMIDYVPFHRNQYHGGDMLTYPYMFMTFNHLQISIPSSSQEQSDRMNWGCCKHTHSATLCHIQWAQYWLNWRAMTAFSERLLPRDVLCFTELL